MSEIKIEIYQKEVDDLLKEYSLFDDYHCKIKDNSMLRIIELESKKRIFVKEELCEIYIKLLKDSKEFTSTQFDKMNERNFFVA
jgi:hypothetical protein